LVEEKGAERALDGKNADYASLDLSFFLSPLSLSSGAPANLSVPNYGLKSK
jgi:hypothetical protein